MNATETCEWRDSARTTILYISSLAKYHARVPRLLQLHIFMIWDVWTKLLSAFFGSRLAVNGCNVHGESESRKSSVFRPVVEVSYVVPVRYAVSRVSPFILVVEVSITTTSPCVWRTGSAHALMTQLISKISASTAEHMRSVANCKKGAPGVQRTVYPAFETESLIGVCAIATPFPFSHIVGELFPRMEVDTTLASIQLF